MDLNLQEDKDLNGLIMDEQLNKLYQAFNDYKKERSLDYVDPGDFTDNYLFDNNNIDSTNYDYLHSNAQSTIMQISKDFEVFERTELAPTTKTPIEFNNNIDPLVSDMASDSSNYDNFHNDAQSNIMQISKDFEAFESTVPIREIPIEYNNNIDQLGEEVNEIESMIEEMASGTSQYNSSGPVVRYFFCGQTKNVLKAKNNGRKRQKRKYRGVVMSEEQRLLKMAQQKIKNREVAAKAHEMRMVS